MLFRNNVILVCGLLSIRLTWTSRPVGAFRVSNTRTLTRTTRTNPYACNSRTTRSDYPDHPRHHDDEVFGSAVTVATTATTLTPTPTGQSVIDTTPAQLRQASLERWRQLPESYSATKRIINAKNTTTTTTTTTNAVAQQSTSPTNLRKGAYQKHIQSLHPDHPLTLGVTQTQRSAEFLTTAENGNATRLQLLLHAGVDVNARDIYRITSLHYAASHGHAEVVQLLLRWGAHVVHATRNTTVALEPNDSLMGSNERGIGCSLDTSLSSAFANGHFEIYKMLIQHSSFGKDTVCNGPTATHFNDTAVQRQFIFGQDPMSLSNLVNTTSVIPMNSHHLGAGSFYIDNAFCSDFIDKLVTLHDFLRTNGRQPHPHSKNDVPQSPTKTLQSTNSARRSHYCDTEGWLTQALTHTLQTNSLVQQQSSPSLPQNHVFSHVRFISYLGDTATTSLLRPHIDHPVLDRFSGRTSTHTFILYLMDVTKGGETVLLDYLPANNEIGEGVVRYSVQPVRGRLFVFPHGCPHAGRRVVEGSKLILRGDICDGYTSE